ncbi:PREDICTED: nicalin-1-like [Populus euphratica]|uniref:Nicalin n=1 Tax=Populus euphratica TaxID=75702 RepID=A0AAJ6V935_POPEU|nr:PREDICTED: nicalin-1-like [Populus euphratica]
MQSNPETMLSKNPRERQMLESIYSMIALVFILVTCVDLCDAATVVDVYRLIQYDISGVPFGSRFATLNHHAGSLHFAPGVDLSRTVLIIPVRELNITFVKEYISQRKPLGGLLFLLPQMFNFENREAATESKYQIHEKELMKTVLVELERLLIHANIPYPVYFAFEDDDIDAVLADVKRSDVSGQPATATTGGYKFVVSAPEPKRIASPGITNIQGWLRGLKADGDPNQLPTIAIVASYDTFGTAPALSVGSDSNGSGIVALLEIARLFSLLYSNPKTRGRYNLLFGLTSGGPYNYNGTHKWLWSFDQRLRESIDYAICLNSIGSWDNELWIHVSKPPENAFIKQIFEGFSTVAEELGLEVGLKHKKINISNPRVAWEHEQFSKLRVTAATLSELSTAPELLESTGGLSDSRHFINETAIVRSIKLVAESIARHIYGCQGKNIQIFADDTSLAVNAPYIRSWLDLLSKTPRVVPFLTKNDPFVMALKKELEDHTHEVNVHHEVLDGMFTLYDSTKAKLNIYQVASVTFDLLLLLVLGSYLIILFTFLVITTRGLDDLISLFRRPPSRKVKTA